MPTDTHGTTSTVEGVGREGAKVRTNLVIVIIKKERSSVMLFGTGWSAMACTFSVDVCTPLCSGCAPSIQQSLGRIYISLALAEFPGLSGASTQTEA